MLINGLDLLFNKYYAARLLQVQLVLQVCAITGGTIRVLVDELKPIRPRYKVPDVLTREPVYERYATSSIFFTCMELERQVSRNGLTSL